MTALSPLLVVLLAVTGPAGGESGTLIPGTETPVLDLFRPLGQAFTLEGVQERVPDPPVAEAVSSRRFRIRSQRPREESAAGPLYLRASLTATELESAEAAAREVERGLAAADPDTGISYAWDLVAARGVWAYHLHAACTFSEESFLTLVEQLQATADPGPTGPGPSFWCRCGGGCRRGAPADSNGADAPYTELE